MSRFLLSQMKVGGVMNSIRNLFGIEINVNINGDYSPNNNSPNPLKVIILLMIIIILIVMLNSDSLDDECLKALLKCLSGL